MTPSQRYERFGPIQSLTPICKLCSIFRYAVASWVVMADDWQVGDLALCVDDGPIHCGFMNHDGSDAKRRGQIGLVASIRMIAACGCSKSLIFDDGKTGLAIRYRKIRPLSDEERDSFLADLDEPVRTRQPVMTILEKGRSL